MLNSNYIYQWDIEVCEIRFLHLFDEFG
jgi:hypothetical protein